MVIYQVLLNFFVSNPTLGKMECKHCHRCVSRRTYCMKRHLENCDTGVFEEFNNMLGNQSTESRKKTKVNKKMHSMSWGVDSFEMFLVEQMVEEGGSSSKFTNPCFKKYFGDVADTLEVSLEAPNVHKVVMDKYFSRKQQVVNKVKNNFVFIKIDYHVRRDGDRYLAVHCQFYDEEIKQKTLYTLAVSKLHGSNKQTGNLVKEFVLNTLEEFSIKKQQVLYVVTDQALINMEVGEAASDDSFEQQDNEDDIADELLSHFANVTKEFGLKNRKCVAHELQTVINVAMHNSGCDELLAQLLAIKNTASKSADIKQRLEWKNYINCKTSSSWLTKYDITSTLCEFKSVYLSLQREFPQLYISTQSWEELEEVRSLLSYCDIFANPQLEEQHFTPSKFWFRWSKARHELEQAQDHLISGCGFNLCKELTEGMREKEKELLQNPMLLAAIYLDPQCRESLAVAVDIGEAKDAFAEVASYLFEKELKKKQPQEANQMSQVLASSFQSNGVELDDSDDEMLELLNERRRERRFGADLREVQNEVALFKDKLQQESLHQIMSFADSDSVSDVLWEYATPAQKAAVTVTAIPITQRSVGRLFSAIEVMENPLNAHDLTKKYLLEAIVFLKTNGCSAPSIPQTLSQTLNFKSNTPLTAIPYSA